MAAPFRHDLKKPAGPCQSSTPQWCRRFRRPRRWCAWDIARDGTHLGADRSLPFL